MKEFVLQGSGPARKSKIDYEKELNPEQLAVVREGDGACLVLAGAGSGKTRTVTYRVAYLLESGVSPDEILLLTFTNKAAKEMLSRVGSVVGGGTEGIWGGTFHSVANRLLRQFAPAVGYTPNFTILDWEDSKDLIKLCVKEVKADAISGRFPAPGVLLAVISYARNAGKKIADVIGDRQPNAVAVLPTIERVAELYDARKRAADAMDFDDLLMNARTLLADDARRQRISSKFRYVLVDEYQDTNTIQAQFVNYLASAHGNLLVVGDDAQSIYSFRAADIRNILDFPKQYPGAKVFRLTANYRSSPEILTVANNVIHMNRDQFRKDLRAMRESFEKPSLTPSANAPQEARYIAEQALALKAEGVPLSEMAVLFRAAFHSQALEFELMKRDIPYEYRGGMKFFERAHIKDVVAHLRLLANPKDESAWMRVLGLQGGIGLVTATKIVGELRAHGTIEEVLAAQLKLPARAHGGWTSARDTLKRLHAAPRPGDMIRAAVSGNYRDYLQAEYPDASDRLDDLEQFALFADGYQALTSFLDDVSLKDDYGAAREGEEGEREDRMILSTIHQAKGLEWDAVFVMHLAEGKFPHERSYDEEGGVEEERRLFYVAVTRARRRLFLTYPVTSGHDMLLVGAPSPFLSEIDPEALETVRLREAPQPQSRWRSSPSFDDEPTIVLDDLGERTNRKAPPSSFLRNFD